MPTTRELITINITRQTQAVSREGFSTPLILGSSATFPERVRTYNSVDAVAEDFATSDNEYIMASKIYSQDSPPVTIKIGRTDVGDTGITESITEVAGFDNNWFFLLHDDHTVTVQEDLADWAEANRKMYITSTQDVDAYDGSVSTDIGSILQDKSLDNTMIIWSGTADTEFAEAAMVGVVSTTVPGSTTWAFKNLNGITVDSLTPTQEAILRGDQFSMGKGYNVYVTTGGVNIVFDGRMVGGEWNDVIRGAISLEARMRENIFSTLVNSSKIPFNDEGTAIIRANMLQTLKSFSDAGFLEPDYTVNVPDVRSDDYDFNLRVNRVANGFTFTANLTGAILYVGIQGTLIS
jgi:hypothetical protein